VPFESCRCCHLGLQRAESVDGVRKNDLQGLHTMFSSADTSRKHRLMSSKRQFEGKVDEPSSPVAENVAVEKKKAVKKPKVAAAPPGPVYDPVKMRKKEVEGDRAMKILSWNVAGLRAFLKKVWQ